MPDSSWPSWLLLPPSHLQCPDCKQSRNLILPKHRQRLASNRSCSRLAMIISCIAASSSVGGLAPFAEAVNMRMEEAGVQGSIWKADKEAGCFFVSASKASPARSHKRPNSSTSQCTDPYTQQGEPGGRSAIAASASPWLPFKCTTLSSFRTRLVRPSTHSCREGRQGVPRPGLSRLGPTHCPSSIKNVCGCVKLRYGSMQQNKHPA